MTKHDHCTHVSLKYCEHCDVTYCLDCKKEWGANSTFTPYPTTITTFTDFPNTDPIYATTCAHA